MYRTIWLRDEIDLRIEYGGVRRSTSTLRTGCDLCVRSVFVNVLRVKYSYSYDKQSPPSSDVTSYSYDGVGVRISTVLVRDLSSRTGS